MGASTALTVEQFQRLRLREDYSYELNEGELVTVGNAPAGHEMVKSQISQLLGAYALERQTVKVFSETAFVLRPGVVRIPDVSVVSKETLSRMNPDRLMEGAPGIAIEVVSPSDTAIDVQLKTDQYLAAGASCVWLVYPALRKLIVNRPKIVEVYREDDEIPETALLEGFRAKVSRIFE